MDGTIAYHSCEDVKLSLWPTASATGRLVAQLVVQLVVHKAINYLSCAVNTRFTHTYKFKIT